MFNSFYTTYVYTPGGLAEAKSRSRLDFFGGLEGHKLHMNCAGHGLLTATSAIYDYYKNISPSFLTIFWSSLQWPAVETICLCGRIGISESRCKYRCRLEGRTRTRVLSKSFQMISRSSKIQMMLFHCIRQEYDQVQLQNPDFLFSGRLCTVICTPGKPP